MLWRGRNKKTSEAAPDIEGLDRLYRESYERVPETP
jgi:hypothetical protein